VGRDPPPPPSSSSSPHPHIFLYQPKVIAGDIIGPLKLLVEEGPKAISDLAKEHNNNVKLYQEVRPLFHLSL
jgi:hypothetical protein